MKYTELQGKSEDQLKELVLNLKKEAFNLRFQVASGEAENPNRFREVRRDIARVKTLQAAQAKPAAPSKKAAKK